MCCLSVKNLTNKWVPLLVRVLHELSLSTKTSVGGERKSREENTLIKIMTAAAVRNMLRKRRMSQVCFFFLGCCITYGLTRLTTINIQFSQGPDMRSDQCSIFTTEADSSVAYILDNLKNTPTDQYSPCLSQIVREVVVQPSKLPYNLEDGRREHSHGQAQLIKKLFRGMVGAKYQSC